MKAILEKRENNWWALVKEWGYSNEINLGEDESFARKSIMSIRWLLYNGCIMPLCKDFDIHKYFNNEY